MSITPGPDYASISLHGAYLNLRQFAVMAHSSAPSAVYGMHDGTWMNTYRSIAAALTSVQCSRADTMLMVRGIELEGCIYFMTSDVVRVLNPHNTMSKVSAYTTQLLSTWTGEPTRSINAPKTVRCATMVQVTHMATEALRIWPDVPNLARGVAFLLAVLSGMRDVMTPVVVTRCTPSPDVHTIVFTCGRTSTVLHTVNDVSRIAFPSTKVPEFTSDAWALSNAERRSNVSFLKQLAMGRVGGDRHPPSMFCLTHAEAPVAGGDASILTTALVRDAMGREIERQIERMRHQVVEDVRREVRVAVQEMLARAPTPPAHTWSTPCRPPY